MELLGFFNQTFSAGDVATIALLIVLEGVLSIDNALVLGLLAKRLPKKQQSKALTYGLVGAFIFRIIAIFTATLLLKWWWVKLLGGGYLVYIAVKHLFFTKEHHHEPQITATPEGEPAVVDAEGRPLPPEAEQAELEKRAPLPVPEYEPRSSFAERFGLGLGYKFWSTVFVIEMTDIAFAIDSILAAIALVGSAPVGHLGPHPKLWVVITGGMLGVVLMRFAAVVFIKMLERFPRFEMAAYLLVIVIGGKLLLDWWFNRPPTPTPPGWHAPLDFHSAKSAAFWTFWGLMVVCFCVGFIPKKRGVATGEA